MKILIVGFGTIGTPLIKLFLETREALDLNEIMFHKNNPYRDKNEKELDFRYRGRIVDFIRWGAKLVAYPKYRNAFETMLAPYGIAPAYSFEEALERADVVIDCTEKEIALGLKEEFYRRYDNGKRLFLAQGSAKGFGKPYAFSVNDAALHHGTDKFLQIVSCNTHQILCVLKTLILDYEGVGNLIDVRCHLDRRVADISQNQSVIGVNIGTPINDVFGAHQTEDADRVLQTIGIREIDMHNTANILPQPFMHVAIFNIRVVQPISRDEVERRFRANPLTAVTYWESNNQGFYEGTGRGHFARILNQTVVQLPSLQVIREGKEIKVCCFTPQDGNSLLSSTAATLWFRNPQTYQDELREHLFKRPFIFDEV